MTIRPDRSAFPGRPTGPDGRLNSDAAFRLTEGNTTVTELPIPALPILTDDARRRRWKTGMESQLDTARMALMDMPDDEAPEVLDATERRADDLLADAVHECTARARQAIREALEHIHSDGRSL